MVDFLLDSRIHWLLPGLPLGLVSSRTHANCGSATFSEHRSRRDGAQVVVQGWLLSVVLVRLFVEMMQWAGW